MVTVRCDYSGKPIFERWEDGMVSYLVAFVSAIVSAEPGCLTVKLLPTDEAETGPLETTRIPGQAWTGTGEIWRISL